MAVCFHRSHMTFVSGSDKILNKKILDIMRCRNCTNFLRPPMFVCAEGHNSCDDCFKANYCRCPECGAIKTNTRSIQLEHIHNASFFRCCFSNLGCSMICRGIMIRMHESHCIFKELGKTE